MYMKTHLILALLSSLPLFFCSLSFTKEISRSFEQQVHEMGGRCCICFECDHRSPLIPLACGHKACSQCLHDWMEDESGQCAFCPKRSGSIDEDSILLASETPVFWMKRIITGTKFFLGVAFAGSLLYALYRYHGTRGS